jgi:tetratricopeptide (TPR) repeat protein
VAADALSKTISVEISAGGVQAVQPHVADLEKALVIGEGGRPWAVADTRYVLADGSSGPFVARLWAMRDPSGRQRRVEAYPNPYPGLALALGAYYNEAGRPDDALRVLAVGQREDTVLGIPGQHLPALINEHAVANGALRRWADALADDDRGLALPNLSAPDRALLLRGRGLALTELGRMDEAAKSYQDSLGLEPGNPRAQSELAYIARLRAGARPNPTVLTMPNAPKLD